MIPALSTRNQLTESNSDEAKTISRPSACSADRRHGTEEVPLEVKIGDRILYGKYTGTEVEIDELTLLVMKESDIYAIVIVR